MSKMDFETKRPLSPHLQVYRMILTMLMSILHRITGAALYFGTILLCVWLIAIASGPESFELVSGFFDSFFGRLILFGFTWALIHHMLGGLRHFVWDLGMGFSKEASNRMAMATIIGSVSITIILWFIGFSIR